MKKLSTRTLLVIFLALASIGSYAYLYTLDERNIKSNETEYMVDDQLNERADGQNDTKLPDLRLLMKLIETGQRFLPAS